MKDRDKIRDIVLQAIEAAAGAIANGDPVDAQMRDALEAARSAATARADWSPDDIPLIRAVNHAWWALRKVDKSERTTLIAVLAATSAAGSFARCSPSEAVRLAENAKRFAKEATGA